MCLLLAPSMAVCWSTHAHLPSASILQSLCPTFLFILEPSCPEAVMPGSVPIPHKASCSLQMVASSPLHALRNKAMFQWRYHFTGRPSRAIRIGWKKVIQTIREPRPRWYSDEQNDKLPSQTGSGFTETINFHVFLRASKKSPSFPTWIADESALAGTKAILLLK